MPILTLGGDTFTPTEEQLAEIKKILTPKQGKWVPEEGRKYWVCNTEGDIFHSRNNSIFDKNMINYNQAFETEAEALQEKQRRLGAERRFKPNMGEGYKTVGWKGSVHTNTFANDIDDGSFYFEGRMWSPDTPDEVINAWYKEYKNAWLVYPEV